MSEVETAKYTITGLVDFMDEQGNIRGQFEVGSVQELPVEIGETAVADGRAELFVEEEAVADASDDEEVEEDEDSSDDGLDEDEVTEDEVE